jgi:hypothetical protein
MKIWTNKMINNDYRKLRDWQAWFTMQHINLCGTAVPNICFATRPCLSRIGSIWCENILYLERRSS